jgi:hypothetical protein
MEQIRRRKMRVIAAVLISLSVVASPAFASADSFNSMNREMSTGGDSLGWVYGPEGRERNAKVVLAKLRALCSSNHHYDQYFCALGMKVLNKAYAEYKIRKAAETTFAE